MVKTIVLLFALLAYDGVRSHPLHTSYTEITRDRTSGTVSISVRLSADDFGEALKDLGGDGSEAMARAYFERSVTLTTRDGKPVPLTWCGMRTAEGLTWLCARSIAPVPSGKLSIRNALMFDRFADQVSIVRWTAGSESSTVVLSRKAYVATLN